MAGFDFAGKTVWVTGAGKGIGYTTALAFANAGAEVTGFDREFPQDNYPFTTEVLDVANVGQVVEVCQRPQSARAFGCVGQCRRYFAYGCHRCAKR